MAGRLVLGTPFFDEGPPATQLRVGGRGRGNGISATWDEGVGFVPLMGAHRLRRGVHATPQAKGGSEERYHACSPASFTKNAISSSRDSSSDSPASPPRAWCENTGSLPSCRRADSASPDSWSKLIDVCVATSRDSGRPLVSVATSSRVAPSRNAAVMSCAAGANSERVADGAGAGVPISATNGVAGAATRSGDICDPVAGLSMIDWDVALAFPSMISDHELIVPTSSAARSSTTSVQVPLAFLLLNFDSRPSGRNVPVNGANPLEIPFDAWSSRTVLVKLSPDPPRRLTSRTSVLSGPRR